MENNQSQLWSYVVWPQCTFLWGLRQLSLLHVDVFGGLWRPVESWVLIHLWTSSCRAFSDTCWCFFTDGLSTATDDVRVGLAQLINLSQHTCKTITWSWLATAVLFGSDPKVHASENEIPQFISIEGIWTFIQQSDERKTTVCHIMPTFILPKLVHQNEFTGMSFLENRSRK
jgi:hypothetical protein